MTTFFGFLPLEAKSTWQYTCIHNSDSGRPTKNQYLKHQLHNHVSLLVPTTGPVIVNSRYSQRTATIQVPYCCNNVELEFTITPSNKQVMVALVSWLIENNIDLNNISEIDEFTLLMISE